MKIKSIHIYQSPVKLKEPFVISLGPLTHALNIVVVVKTDEGIAGFGECSPFMTIHGESMETCFIVGQYLSKALIGANPLEIETCTQTMNRIIYGNSSIKSAFDMALYDIASQHAGVPLYAFLGGKVNKELVTDYTISLGEKNKMVADALAIKGRGFTVIKVKLGGKGEADIERLTAIREAIGPEIPLRIDANQGWDVDTAIRVLKAVAHLNIQHCEEPIPRWNFMQLSELAKESPLPIMADESCCDHHDAERLIALGACGLFNIKLGKSAGIFNAMKIVTLAEANGIGLQVGGFLESRLGFTASAHLTLAAAQVPFCDFDTPMMFEEDPVLDGITYGKGGTVKVPEAPGLGATMDAGYLQGLQKFVWD